MVSPRKGGMQVELGQCSEHGSDQFHQESLPAVLQPAEQQGRSAPRLSVQRIRISRIWREIHDATQSNRVTRRTSQYDKNASPIGHLLLNGLLLETCGTDGT
jgi:hypothetical protein